MSVWSFHRGCTTDDEEIIDEDATCVLGSPWRLNASAQGAHASSPTASQTADALVRGLSPLGSSPGDRLSRRRSRSSSAGRDGGGCTSTRMVAASGRGPPRRSPKSASSASHSRRNDMRSRSPSRSRSRLGRNYTRSRSRSRSLEVRDYDYDRGRRRSRSRSRGEAFEGRSRHERRRRQQSRPRSDSKATSPRCPSRSRGDEGAMMECLRVMGGKLDGLAGSWSNVAEQASAAQKTAGDASDQAAEAEQKAAAAEQSAGMAVLLAKKGTEMGAVARDTANSAIAHVHSLKAAVARGMSGLQDLLVAHIIHTGYDKQPGYRAPVPCDEAPVVAPPPRLHAPARKKRKTPKAVGCRADVVALSSEQKDSWRMGFSIRWARGERVMTEGREVTEEVWNGPPVRLYNPVLDKIECSVCLQRGQGAAGQEEYPLRYNASDQSEVKGSVSHQIICSKTFKLAQ